MQPIEQDFDASEYPIHEILPALRECLGGHSSAVLQAPPGAGKTTIVPLALLKEPWLVNRGILILEPRRLAARAAAARMSDLLREPIGETVGFRIRFESKVSRKTRIEVLTEGILTRRLQSDPGLEGIGLVIFDEFHERHLHSDLALALLLNSRRVLGLNLKVLVMSATLDGAAVAALLDDAPVLTSPGRSFPVDIRHSEKDPVDLIERLPQIMQQAVRHALDQDSGNILAFLPGAWEIRRTRQLLKPLSARGLEILPLYGDLPWESQTRAIRPSGGVGRRVVLATPIAETSLTIEGVGVVIDSGLARQPRFDPSNGLTRLATVRISRASAEQRSGRAGRTGPGVCYRLWSVATHGGLMAHPVPEIRSADLAPLALEMALWGAADPSALHWLDPPPHAALAQAYDLLMQLGALDAARGITPAGRAMAALPIHPRLAHMVDRARQRDLGGLACDIAALLSERDILAAKPHRSCDFTDRLEALRAYRRGGREAAQSAGADPAACARVEQTARQVGRLCRIEAGSSRISPESVGLLLAWAYPDRIAQQRAPRDYRYLLSSGRGARLPEREHPLRQPYLVAASLDAGDTEGKIHLAAAVDLDILREEEAIRLQTAEVVRWDEREGKIVARVEERLGCLILKSTALAKPDPEMRRTAVLEAVRRIGIAGLPWTRDARQWQARVLSLRHWCPDEGWPDLSDDALQARLDDWLAPFLGGVARRQDLERLDLLLPLRNLLDPKLHQRLDEGAPGRIVVPSGASHRLEYRPGESPVLSVKLQEMFGLADTPRVAWGRVPVTLHLLSPARRPIQVTQDLRGFWEHTYPEVRKELRARYPKHPWPEDPWNAPPTARTKRRKP